MKQLICVSRAASGSWQAVPLGAACIASALKADPRLTGRVAVSLADFGFRDDAAFIADDLASRPDAAGAVFFFSVYVWNRSVLSDTARILRSRLPDAVFVAGGPEVTGNPAGLESSFDYLVSGEGELDVPELACALLDGRVPSSGTGRAVSLPRTASPDCASCPSPWLDGTLDGCRAVSEEKGALWELARGCPFKCAYCYESRGDHRVRPLPLARLEAELARFLELGIERVFVLDPTYNAHRERALGLLHMLAKKGEGIHFSFEARAEQIDRELAAAFAAIPCSLQIGLQSTNQQALELVNRKTDLKLFAKRIGLLNEAGVVFGLDLMYGLPGDSLSGFRNSLDWALSLWPNNLEIFRLAVLPGTELADKADGLGLRWQQEAPYLVESAPQWSKADLERAGQLARACDLLYTRGRAVSWFLPAVRVLGLKPGQIFADFAVWLDCPEGRSVRKKKGMEAVLSENNPDHRLIEELQLAFFEFKYRQKECLPVFAVLQDVIRLNGAWTRALAEGLECKLDLSWHPEDLFGPGVLDLAGFAEHACMEQCSVRIYSGPDGPDMELVE